MATHGGDPDNVVEVVCDMSQALLSVVSKHLPRTEVTVDWFNIVQTFTKRLDEVCKKVLKELVADRIATADAWVIRDEAALDPEGPDAASGPVAYHELPQGHVGGGLPEATAEAEEEGSGVTGADHTFSVHEGLMLAAMPGLDTLPHRYGKQRIKTCLFTPPTKTP
ncbi:transposase [Halomonas sp.]|uniref:transposase n=1 Tax=Halomonas sp. TaxID=1486246 RepID=UPI00298E11CA|nr:transposase [Halomonas sp.]MDW7748941.1 transposase [Halomonas sp.]